MTLVNEINLLQDFMKRIIRVENAPELSKYPVTMDSLWLPMAITELVSSEPRGANDINTATDDFKILVIVSPLGEANYGYVQEKSVMVANAIREAFLSDSSYAEIGMRTLQTNPYRIRVSQDSFTISGPTVVERPVGTENWFYAITVDLKLIVDWRVNCGL
jgi:hypothetical protein